MCLSTASISNTILANFLLGNYKQIQQILDELPLAIAALQSGKMHDDTDYYQHLEAEHQYLGVRKKESDKDKVACEYIHCLLKYKEAQCIQVCHP